MRRTWALVAVTLLLTACGDDAANGGPNDDADGDSITNAQEGMDAKVNTDGDGYLDFLDLDSDADGIFDADEAGDADLATAPADTDGNGVPDFQDTDSDGDEITDTDELDAEFAMVDTDGDGIMDHLDVDADGDTIADRDDKLDDRNQNGVPNFRDLDSDGDGIPDAIEAGDDDPDTVPIDTDGDLTPNFLDLDSDGDFVPDAEEDKNGNGIVDPGESSPLLSDTDGDGTPDIVEIIAGSDPNDPGQTIPPGDFYFVLPFEGPGADGLLDFTTNVKQADVFVSMDTTGSFGEEIDAVQQAFATTIIPGITAIIPDVAFGVGAFEDMPLQPFGLPGDKPYELLQPITTDSMLIAAGIAALGPANGGLDTPEAGYESLYQWASGVGIPELGYQPFAPENRIGGVGFRKDSLPIIIQITDADSHVAADYQGQVPSAHTANQTVAALNAIGARVIGVDSLEHANSVECLNMLPGCMDPRPYLEDMAVATRATIPPDVNSGMCLMGVNNAPLAPVMVNNQPACPVVFDVQPDGTGLGSLIVDAVAQLATLGVLDISTRTIGQDMGLLGEVITPGFDTSDFIIAVTPVAPPPTGATIAGDVFVGVTPGSTVTFKVDGFNDFQPSTDVPQLFQANIEVLGDLVTLLDVRNVFIIVPPEIPDVPKPN
jgi:hypothetical protein